MKTLTLLLLAVMLLYGSSQAQVQFSAITSLIRGSGYYDNHAMLLGGGFSMRYMIKEHIFIGACVRTYKASTTAYESYNAQDRTSNFNGTLDYMFNKRQKVQPYVGIGAGLSTATHMINYIRVYKNYTVFSMRAGAQIAIGKSTGFFMQGEYNYTPGEGQPSPLDGIRNPVTTEPISKYVAVDCGLYMRLYMATNK